MLGPAEEGCTGSGSALQNLMNSEQCQDHYRTIKRRGWNTHHSICREVVKNTFMALLHSCMVVGALTH